MRRLFLPVLIPLFLYTGCPLPEGELHSIEGADSSGPRQVLLYFGVGEGEVAAHLSAAADTLAYHTPFPSELELLLYVATGAERFYRRTPLGVEELPVNDLLGGVGAPPLARLKGFLDYAHRGYPDSEVHLILAGESAWGDRLLLAQNGAGTLPAGEVADAIEGASDAADGPWLRTLVLAASYTGELTLIHQFRRSAGGILAFPGPLPVAGIAAETLLDQLSQSGSLASALWQSYYRPHAEVPGFRMARFAGSAIESTADALEEVLDELQPALESYDVRTSLREAFYAASPETTAPGPFFLPLSSLTSELASRNPALASATAELDAALASVQTRLFPEADGSAQAPGAPGGTLYYVSRDESGAPSGHAACYVPDRPGHEGGAYLRASLWPPRMEEETGTLYKLWYDLPPMGGAE